MISNIDDLRIYLKLGKVESSDVLAIMVVLRIQINKLDSKKEYYKWLRFFANWCVHGELSGSNFAVDIAEFFYEQLNNYDSTKENSVKHFFNLIFDNLRSEIKKMFVEHDISASLVDDDQVFCDFIIRLMLIIKDRPVNMPKRQNTSIKNKIKMAAASLRFVGNRKDIDLTPVSFVILHNDNGNFDFKFTTVGMKGGSLSFQLSPIGYKNKRLAYKQI